MNAHNEQQGFTAGDMADQGARQFGAGYAAAKAELRNAILQLQEDALHMKDPGDTVNAYNRVLALIDASHVIERPTAPVVREVAIGETVTVADLAQKLALKGGEVVKALFKMGVMATINQSIDHETAALVAEKLGHKVVPWPDGSVSPQAGDAEVQP